MSKMSQTHAELSEQAYDLGYSSLGEAFNDGYESAYFCGDPVLFKRKHKSPEPLIHQPTLNKDLTNFEERLRRGGRMRGYCCECRKDVDCEMVKGDAIYPHRPDLYDLNFVRCPICGNYTGKYDGEYPTLPTAHIRSCRYKAHRALDKIWSDRNKRGEYYGFMSNHFGKDFHWGLVRSDEEADRAYEYTIDFISSLIGEEEK